MKILIKKCNLVILSIIILIVQKLNAQQSKPDFNLLKYNNPGLVVDLGVGLWAWPLPIDYNGDGKLDLLVACQGKPFNGLYLFEDRSNKSEQVFEKPIFLHQSIKDIQVSYIEGKPRFTIPGYELLNFTKDYDKNKKSLFPIDSIKKDIKGNSRFNQWKLVDFDNDGDVDIVVGIDDWFDYGWDNGFNEKGEWIRGPLHGYVYLIENVNEKYINRGRIKADGKEIDVYGAPTPNFANFDGDGDLDLICGEFLDKMTYFENIGTREKPIYKKGKYLKNENGIIKMDLEMIIPVAVDWNNDGLIDLIVGDEDGRVAFIENTGKVKDKMPQFKNPVYLKQKADNVKFGALATPFSVDWDGDGDEDIITGNSAGYIGFIENLGQFNGMPRWAAPKLLKSEGEVIRIMAGYNGSIQGPAEEKWGYTTLSVSDWDGDGLKDLVVNSIFGEVIWYKNVGTITKPKLTKPQNVLVDWGTINTPYPFWNWKKPEGNSLVTQWRTTPFVIDWNKDGLADLIMLDMDGYLSYFERGTKDNQSLLKLPKRVFYGLDYAGYNSNHLLRDQLPGDLRLNVDRLGRSGRRKFTIGDWDGDGKLDILVNSVNVSCLQNKGLKNGKVILENKGDVSNTVLAGHDTSPTIVDWNRDGIPDLLVGAEDGHFYYLIQKKK